MNRTKPRALLMLSLLAIGCAADDMPMSVASTAAVVEQTTPGTRPPPTLVESFDGLGFGFQGPHGPTTGRNPSDNSLAVGPNHIVQTVNSRLAIFGKRGELFDTTGDVLYGVDLLLSRPPRCYRPAGFR